MMRKSLGITIACLLIVIGQLAACRVSFSPKTSTTSSTATSSPYAAKPIQTLSPPSISTPGPTKMELSQAVSEKLVEIEASSSDLASIEVSLRSKSDAPLEVIVEPGVMFQGISKKKLALMVTKSDQLILNPGEDEQSFTLDAVDMNMDSCACPCPDYGDELSISNRPVPEDVKKLLALPEFQEEEFSLRQFAVWTITNNPTPKGYSEIDDDGLTVKLGSGGIQKIKELFESAGISTNKYRALR